MRVKFLQGRRPAFLMRRSCHSIMVIYLMFSPLVGLNMHSSGVDGAPQQVLNAAQVSPVVATQNSSAQPSPTASITTEPRSETVATRATVIQTVKAPAIAQCTKNNAYSVNVPLLNLAQASEGLTYQKDPTYYYDVYGTTRNDVRSQIQQCGPSGEFAGQAAYALNWSYAISRVGEVCYVKNVKVGLRTSVILPNWHPASNADQSLIERLQGGMTNIATHEYGHVAIAEQYANQLLLGLQTYPVSNCATAAQDANNYANGVFSSLKNAQAVYDNQTGHGASRGAIL